MKSQKTSLAESECFCAYIFQNRDKFLCSLYCMLTIKTYKTGTMDLI